MSYRTWRKRKLKVLITVKTYPIPSTKYDELVCTAGVTEEGEFIRLYPINFRDLPYEKQYKKYQWIEVEVMRHEQTDIRKESFRPDNDTLKILGNPILPNSGNWDKRKRYVLKKEARSLDELKEQFKVDQTSLGIFKPQKIEDFIVSSDSEDWKPEFYSALQQHRLWEERKSSLKPPRKVPYKFHYKLKCEDERCKGHKLSIHDWELGALYWKLIDDGHSENETVQRVRERFFDELCSETRDTYLFVGTMKDRFNPWIVLGLFYPKKELTRDLFGFGQE
ncbi:MAG: hypothetical protein F4039_02270 [Gammaproteobacteria bacterium]|nr:hypothetical protein [Gammaproteobacteria bacterium]MYF53863.1 hypothetical protein [Gammaproteobacteria bacterium]MYK42900.1 hypothetical protein [Gammaproteobacteria bacterium]